MNKLRNLNSTTEGEGGTLFLPFLCVKVIKTIFKLGLNSQVKSSKTFSKKAALFASQSY